MKVDRHEAIELWLTVSVHPVVESIIAFTDNDQHHSGLISSRPMAVQDSFCLL